METKPFWNKHRNSSSISVHHLNPTPGGTPRDVVAVVAVAVYYLSFAKPQKGHDFFANSTPTTTGVSLAKNPVTNHQLPELPGSSKHTFWQSRYLLKG